MTENGIDAEHTFTFQSGTVVHLQLINRLFVGKVTIAAEERWKAENGENECPTFSVKLAGGGEEVRDHNETTIATEPWSEDEEVQDAWREYQEASQELMGVRTDASVRVILKEGVTDDPPDVWREKRGHYGLEIPDHLLDARFEWLHDESTGWAELIDLAWEIQTLPSELEATATAAGDMFRDQVDGPDAGANDSADQAGIE